MVELIFQVGQQNTGLPIHLILLIERDLQETHIGRVGSFRQLELQGLEFVDSFLVPRGHVL